TLTWNAGNLSPSGSTSFTITTTARAGGVHKNIATVSANEGDNVPANNSASASVTPNISNAVDLKVVQVASNETPTVGNSVTFTVTTSNEGPMAATGVVALVQLANGFTITSVTPSSGTSYTPPSQPGGKGTWTIGSMAN